MHAHRVNDSYDSLTSIATPSNLQASSMLQEWGQPNGWCQCRHISHSSNMKLQCQGWSLRTCFCSMRLTPWSSMRPERLDQLVQIMHYCATQEPPLSSSSMPLQEEGPTECCWSDQASPTAPRSQLHREAIQPTCSR